MSKFQVLDRTVTLSRIYSVTNIPVYNSKQLYNTNIDPALQSSVESQSVLVYDGEKWIASTPSPVQASAFASFISMTEQKPNSTTAGKAITYDSKTVGVAINIKNNAFPGSKIVIPSSGVYRLLFSAQCDSISGNNHKLDIWPVVDGTAVPNSNTRIVLNSGAESCLTVEYFLSLAAASEVELYMTGNSTTDCRIVTYPSSGTIPAIPSIIVTINKI